MTDYTKADAILDWSTARVALAKGEFRKVTDREAYDYGFAVEKGEEIEGQIWQGTDVRGAPLTAFFDGKRIETADETGQGFAMNLDGSDPVLI